MRRRNRLKAELQTCCNGSQWSFSNKLQARAYKLAWNNHYRQPAGISVFFSPRTLLPFSIYAMKPQSKKTAGARRGKSPAALRRRAEARLKSQPPAASGQPSELESQQLLHELQIHQVELELQNEELRKSQAEVETAAARFTDLYDFAPAGYFTLDCKGVIARANLTGASLLGCERGRLTGRRLGIFVAQADRAALSTLLRQVFQEEAAPACDLTLVNDGQPPRVVRLTAKLAPVRTECFVLAVDVTERRRTEDLARQWQQMFQSAEFSLARTDPATNTVLAVNAACATSLGYACEEMVGKKVLDIYPLEVHAELRQRMQATDQVGHLVFESVHLRKNGTRFPVLVDVTTIYDEWNQPTARVAYALDLTERKQAEARLRQSEAHYRLLAENSSDVIWLLDLSTQRLSYVSPSTEKLRGYTVAEMMQQTLPELMTPESYQIVAHTLPARLAAFAAGDDSVRSKHQEIWVPCRDGSVIPTEVVTTLIADEHRQVTQILGVSRDITERKRTELELGRTTGLLEEAQRAARVGYYVNDLSTGHWESSPVLDEIFGIPADYPRDVPGWGRLIHPEDQAATVQHYNIAINGDGKFRGDYRVIRPSDGQLRWAAAYGRFEYSPEGKPVRLVGCIQDITERKAAEEALRQSEGRLRSLLASMDDLVFVLNRDLVFEEFYQPSKAELLIPPESFVGKHFEDIGFPEPALGIVKRATKSTLESGITSQAEYYLDLPQGRAWFDIHVTAFQRSEGLSTGVIWVVRNITSAKRITAALQESELRLSTALQGADMGVWDWDIETGKIVWSGSHEALCGYSPGEFPGTYEAFLARVHSEDIAGMELEVKRSIHDGSNFHHEFRVVWPDGSARWVRSHGQPIFDDKGSTVRMVGVAFDITDRKCAELSLSRLNAELEQRVRERTAEALDLYHHAPCGYHSLGPDGLVLQMNDTELGWLGYSREEVVGLKRLPDLMMPESAALFEKHFLEFRGQFAPTALEWDMRCKDGSTISILVIAEVVRDQAGRFLHTRSAVINITERKRLESTLRESEQRHRDLINTMPDWVWEVDERGVYTFSGPQCQALLGYEPEEVLGRTPFDFLAPDEGKRLGPLIEQLFARGEPIVGLVNTNLHKNGSLVVLETNGIPLWSVDGQFRGYRGLDHDITERKRAEEALQASEEKFRRLYHSMSEGMALHTMLCDAAGKPVDYVLVSVNPAYEAITGLKAEQVVGRKASELYGTLEAPYLEAYAGVVATGQPAHLETWFEPMGKCFRITIFSPAKDQFATVFEDISERKRAEEKLIFVLKAVESTSDAVGMSDVQARHFYQNRAFSELFGYATAEELETAGGGTALVKDPEVAREMFANLQRGKPWAGELEMVTKSGRVIPAYERADAIKDEAGNLIGLVGIITDISERKQSEAALRLFKDLVEHSSDAIGMSAPNGRHYYQNSAFSRLFGEVEDRPPSTLYVEPAIGKQVFETIMGGGSWLGEVQMFKRDKTILTVFLRAYAIKDHAGQVVGLVGLHTDITERNQAEAQLRTLQSAVEQSPVVVVITDQEGRIEYVNPSFEAQTGYTAAEAIGQKPSVLKSGLTPPEVYVEMWRTLLAGETWRGELCNKRKDGSLFWESAAIAPLRDHAGRLTRFVAIKEDITESRRIAEELSQAKEAAESASRAKSVFLANMSHEIRTPMNAILGFAQLIQRDPALTEQQRQWLHTINRSGEHLIRLISDILDMAKIESGRVPLALEEFDFPALLEDLEAMFRLRVEEKGLRFEIQHAAEIPRHLLSDAGRIRQVLMNLLGNAVKFTEQGGIRLRVTAEPAPPTVSGQPAARLCLEVEDTGPGIAPEDLARVFEAFEQVRNHRSASSGTGLGLAISRRLAQLLSGELIATSQVGAGSTFRFTFVAAVRAAAGGAATSAAVARRVIGLKVQGPPPLVLVVDDTESNRSVVRNLLKLVGFVVRETDNGAAAVASCQAERPALVLMDRRMPGLDGLAATRMIRDGLGGRDIRILIVSADAIEISEEEWKSAGADGFISKPFGYADLLARIGALLKLDYVYAEPSAPAAQARPVLELSDIAQLPAGLRADLIQATESGDGARLRELIAQGVSPTQPALGQAMGQLAAEYKYHALLEALREKGL